MIAWLNSQYNAVSVRLALNESLNSVGQTLEHTLLLRKRYQTWGQGTVKNVTKVTVSVLGIRSPQSDIMFSGDFPIDFNLMKGGYYGDI